MFDFFLWKTYIPMYTCTRRNERETEMEHGKEHEMEWMGGRKNKWERERENEVLEILIFVVALLFLFFRVGNFRVGWGGHGYMLISLAIAWKWALMIGLMTRLWNGRCGTLIAVLIDWTMIMLINWFYWLYWSLVMLCNRKRPAMLSLYISCPVSCLKSISSPIRYENASEQSTHLSRNISVLRDVTFIRPPWAELFMSLINSHQKALENIFTWEGHLIFRMFHPCIIPVASNLFSESSLGSIRKILFPND